MEPPSSRSLPPSGQARRLGQRHSAAVIVADTAWRRMVPGADRLAARAAMAAGGIGTVVLASDLTVKRLNARHRGRNKATNVLTFDSGDVILAAGVVRREAKAAGRRMDHVLAHLVVHGGLHLRGHDHGGVGEARRMEQRETRILHGLRVPNPWRRA